MKLLNIKRIFRQNTDAVVLIFVFNILLFIPSLLAPIYQKIFTDYVFNDGSWLFMLLAMMFLTAIFAGVVNWLLKNCLFRLSNNIEISNLNKYMRIMFNSPLKLFMKKDSYTLLSQAEKSSRISKLLTKDILSLLFDVFRVVFFLILMLRIDITMSLIVIALVVANIVFGKAKTFVCGLFEPKVAAVEAVSDEFSALQGERLYAHGLQNIETFKSTAMESVLFKRFLGEKTAFINAKRDDDFEEACSPIEDLPEILFMNILLLISALRIMDRSFSIGTYLEFQAYAIAFFYPLAGVLAAKTQLTEFEEKLKKFFKELGNNDEDVNTNNETDTVRRAVPVNTKLDGYIEFKNVNFAYDDGIPVIKNFNLSVKPKQRIAVVGKAGSGKTTLMKLLQGLFSPTSGEITIDGIPAAEIDRELFKNSVGCANQEVAIFSASIRENITMWDKNLTDTDIYRAAHDVLLHKFVSSLSGAYEYTLTENGSNISKGQGQKIEIARALIYNPSIVLLDETTRSIDPAGREHIQKVLQERGCTCIMITHLLSQITEYDEIIVLGKGEVIARGKHDDLLNSCKLYKTLFEAESLTVKV